MDFQEVEFYNYTIRMTVVDGVEMYLVSDLLKQYNEINGTKWSSIVDKCREKDIDMVEIRVGYMSRGSDHSSLMLMLNTLVYVISNKSPDF